MINNTIATCDVQGSPRIYKAAHTLFTIPGIAVSDAMKLAGYSKHDITKRSIRQSISKKKNRLIKANEKMEKSSANRRPPLSVITTSSSRANLSDISGSKNSANQPAAVSTVASSSKSNKTNSTKTLTVASARKSIKPRQKAFSKVLISKTSRHTLNQVKAADIEQNANISLLQSAYKWAVSEAIGYKNKVKLAEVASAKFNVTVMPQKLQKLLHEGRDQILPSGPKPVMDAEEFKTISAAVCSFVV
jgi:hypothetical protein